MENWLKIENSIFYAKECEVQLSFERWATLYIILDIGAHPEYYDFFMDIYEGRKLFDMSTIKFAARKCRIKTMDIDFGKKISMSIRCESIDAHDMAIRRDGIIDDILGDRTTFITARV